uniref:Rx_N domain-containing protein n=1 Tax=Angiostrongylus cantonensis TaxID=6313 RepID=A0A0K0DDP4_ANGCA
MRRCSPVNAVLPPEKDLLGTCDSKGVDGVGVLVNTRNLNRAFKIEEMWVNIGFDNLRHLHADHQAMTRLSLKILTLGNELDERHTSTHGLEWRKQVERLSAFIMTTKRLSVIIESTTMK